MRHLQNIELKDFTYYQIGGVCKNLYFPQNSNEISKLVKSLQGQKYIILGAGSNSVYSSFESNSFEHVICFRDMNALIIDADTISAQAGVINNTLCEYAHSNALSGIEWMYGLPGEIGATTRMNARCYGGEISQVVFELEVVNEVGDVFTISDPNMFIGYKNTRFMHSQEIITSVNLKLSRSNCDDIKKAMHKCIDDRIKKQQFVYPSCGCVFKNNYDVGVSAGVLLDKSGAKNLGSANARVSENHANFIYNTNSASSDEIIEISLAMRDLVYQKFEVWLEFEMEIMGVFSSEHLAQIQTLKETNLQNSELLSLKNK